MDLIKIDIDELRNNIDKFEHQTNKKAYLIMNGNTLGCLETNYPSTIWIWNSVKNLRNGIIVEFNHRKVFIDKDIDFGKVEIR